jgi:hypothetical protein
VLYDFKHRRVDELSDYMNNPVNGESIEDTWGGCRVPRDETQDHLSWFDELVIFERKLSIVCWTHTQQW